MKVNVDQEDEKGIVTNKVIDISKETLCQSQKSSSDLSFEVQVIKNINVFSVRVTCDVKGMTQEIEKKQFEKSVRINNQTAEQYK